MTKKIFFLACLLAGAAVTSCGYTTRSLLNTDLRTIHILPIKNNINYTSETDRNLYLPLLEVKIRNAVANRFLFDGNLKIADPEYADLILKAELLNYEREGLRYNAADDRVVDEYRIRIVVSLTLINGKDKTIVWEEPRFTGETTFFRTGPRAVSENVAVEEALEDLARRIVERTIEDW